MLDNETIDRLESKIDKLAEVVIQLRTDFAAHSERNQHVADTVAESKHSIAELRQDMDRGKGVLGFISFLSLMVGALASVFVIFKK